MLSGWTLLGLSACQTTSPKVETPAPPVASPQAPPADARELRVVSEESLLQILVYRGGAMARLGHNHVIASRHLQGSVYLTEDLPRTRFDIRVPVNELTVDEPAMREEAGADFPPGVPQSARDGTRKNLLSAALLDGASHPEIRLRATDVKPGADLLDVGVEITLKGVAHQVRVPVRLERHDDVVIAKGEFALRQSGLGLEPFSVAMGTLVVLDEMRIRFSITAR
jgi:polyisoprenoid-binding protein YceI